MQPTDWLASATVVAFLTIMIGGFWSAWPPATSSGLLCGVAVMWVASAWMVTPSFDLPQAAVRGFSSRSRLRRAARWPQLGWLLAAAAAWGLATSGANPVIPAGLLKAGIAIGSLVGFAGLVALVIMLGRLAEWVRDDRAEKAFALSVWAAPVATILLFVDPPLPFVGTIIGLLWTAAVCCFPYGLLALSGSVTRAVKHFHEHQGRLRRRHQRMQHFDDRVAATVARIDEAGKGRGPSVP